MTGKPEVNPGQESACAKWSYNGRESASKKVEKLLKISASDNSFPRRKFRSRDCPLGKQSHAKPNRPIQKLRSDELQPQNRQGFAFELVRKSHRLVTTPRLAGSRREFLKLFIPCNLSKRRLLRVSDLYRGTRMSPYFATQSE